MFAATILVIIPSIIVYIALQEQVVFWTFRRSCQGLKSFFGEISQKGMRRFALEIKSFRGQKALAFWF